MKTLDHDGPVTVPPMTVGEIQAAMVAVAKAADALARAANILDVSRRSGQPIPISERVSAVQEAREAELELRQMLAGTEMLQRAPADRVDHLPRMKRA